LRLSSEKANKLAAVNSTIQESKLWKVQLNLPMISVPKIEDPSFTNEYVGIVQRTTKGLPARKLSPLGAKEPGKHQRLIPGPGCGNERFKRASESTFVEVFQNTSFSCTAAKDLEPIVDEAALGVGHGRGRAAAAKEWLQPENWLGAGRVCNATGAARSELCQ
jgi:hypothetical protein